jgi:prepilin-type N-terminal cleavage/methylation domain-containing protein
MYPTRASRSAFTLVELLVVIAIIALLISVLLPAIGAVKDQARRTQAQSQFAALDTGLEAYRAEASLGGSLPASAGNDPDNPVPQMIADPGINAGGEPIYIAGAHLLVHAMLGADLLGTPGFVDIDRDGVWADDTNADEGGAYELDDDGQPVRTRYGGAGYVSGEMKSRLRTLGELQDSGRIVSWDENVENTGTRDQFAFVDPWDQPILYYHANRAAQFMVTPGPNAEPGIYTQEDNAIITGSIGGGLDSPGVDFGAGSVTPTDQRHYISRVPEQSPLLPANIVDGVNDVLTDDATYAHTFARFILDTSSRVRNEPVNRDTYLLISPGRDGIYGSDDDITNWTREVR